MHYKDSASLALVQSVVNSGLSEIGKDIAEIALDAALDEGVLKDIPFISWLFRAKAIGTNIRDRLFAKKIILFLFEASKITQKEKQSFSERLSSEEGFAEECGETALMLLDKLSDAEKARLMGYAFRRFVQNDIDSVILHRVYAALEYFPIWQLLALPRYYFDEGLSRMGQGTATLYQTLWLVEIFYGPMQERLHINASLKGGGLISYHQPFYRQTHVGLKVAELVRDYLSEQD